MFNYILRRCLIFVPTILLIALLGFTITELPEGDYVDNYVRAQIAQGNLSADDQADDLREQLGLNRPFAERFVAWLGRFVQGDFGDSFAYRQPVAEVIGQRLVATLIVSISAFLLSWGVGIPLGVFSATHQYSRTDNVLTTIAFIGLGLPDFLIALGFLVAAWVTTGEVLTGLQSAQFINQPFTLAALLDLVKHLWIPVVAVAVTGMAWVMRVMRGNLLNELGKTYITSLRARGVPERHVIWRHAFKNALHPLIASLGQTLAFLINGFAITSIVLDLPTIQAVYLNATLNQDIYTAGTILVLIGFLIMLGTLMADILLAWLDPRIRYS